MKNNESQALLLQTVLEGDEKLGIAPRKVKVKKFGSNMTITGGGLKFKDKELNSSQLILSFINDYVYGIEREDVGILGSNISAKKVASVLSGLTAYSALAWNLSTMPANAIISQHNTRAVSKDNQWFNSEDWLQANIFYTKNYPNLIKDFTKKGFNSQKSLLTQMVNYFDAINGEFLDPNGIIVTKNVGERMLDSALFWTQEIVEHANQTQSMIMLMKGFKIIDEEGKETSLFDAFIKANENMNDGDTMVIPSYLSKEQNIQFQKRLQGVNRQIHGNYKSLDKTMLQKGILTNMMMTFKRFIYDGFRSRFI